MACRFPGAESPAQFWENLVGGVESIARFTDAELIAAGVPQPFLARKDYVKAAPVLTDPAGFDAPFFGFSPGEAAVLDPQHRILLELAQNALDDAACDPQRFSGRIGVFAGSAMNTYFWHAGLAARFAESYIPTLIASDKDFLATRISYKLGLRGPGLTVQTACSTALVAVHLARQSLLSGETDVALAGAVSVRVPHRAGYFHDGGVASADGHVRAFDAAASGTVFGSGAGVLVLKRLTDAIEQGDCIRAVIKGSAVNNDGAQKAGYSAPSVDGQADAVVEALANSGIGADEISYVEAHGSGTPVGDPIEVRALTSAFRRFTPRSGYCRLGSVKPNVGHLDAAAGMAGLIKTALSLQHGRIPGTLHYARPNPEIDFAATPFLVNAATAEWPRTETPRRAGVMATGMGGTNAHVVLEEAPAVVASAAVPGPQLLILSAKTAAALDTAAVNLSQALTEIGAQRTESGGRSTPLTVNETAASTGTLADVAYTLQVGRSFFPHRRFVVCGSSENGAALLKASKSVGAVSGWAGSEPPPVVFLLPGIGDHYAGMSRGLYQRFPVFRAEVDRCAETLQPLLGLDIRSLLYPSDLPEQPQSQPRGIDLKRMLGQGPQPAKHPAAVKLERTLYSQPALFTVEYALARLWMDWGVSPTRIVGHSMGEYVAACLAGVFTLPEALRLIATRARLVSALPEGAMAAVMLPEAELRPLLGEELSLSLINGPQLCVVAGPLPALDRFKEELARRKVVFRPVRNGHAFHSRLLDPMVEEFMRELRSVEFKSPRVPFISNVSGTWITPEQATNPRYWADHARSTARFSDALAELWRIPGCTLLEVGPGRTLGLLALQHPARGAERKPAVLSSLRHDYENLPDAEVILQSLGRLWLDGTVVRWERVDLRPDRRKLALPAYPFEHTRHWIDPQPESNLPGAVSAPVAGRAAVEDWFYVPTWTQGAFAPAGGLQSDQTAWLIAGETSTFARRLLERLQTAGASAALAEGIEGTDDYVRVLGDLKRRSHPNLNVIYLGGLSGPADPEQVFSNLLHLTQALGEQYATGTVRIAAVGAEVHEVTGEEQLRPAMATAIGLCQTIPREYADFSTFSVDLPGADGENWDVWASRLLSEFSAPPAGEVVAYRGKYRWTRQFRPQRLARRQGGLRPRGVYLITGGTGGLGLAIAKHLARACQARLVLTKKTPFPSGGMDPLLAAQLREIEALGGTAEVQVCAADDRAGMRRVMDQIISRYGAVNGAIHAAGILRDGLIQVKTGDAARAVLAPKIEGADILHELLQPHLPDFCVLCSSLSSVLPFHGQSDYSAANAYLDAWAFSANANSAFRTVAIDWPVWREVGILTKMATLAGFGAMHEAVLNRSVSVAEGLEIFDRVLASNLTEVLVSPQSFAVAATECSDRRLVETAAAPDSGEERPQRLMLAEQPQDEVESALGGLWAKILGLPAVGRTQNFLDLGGHSLLAMRIVSAIKADYQIDFTLRKFFEVPTVAGTAAAIRAQVEAEVENLSDEEVSRLSG